MTFRRELLAGIIGSAFVGAGSILVVLLQKHFHASLLHLSLFGSVSSIAYISSIWVNRWMERVGARKLILYGGLMRTGFFALLGLVHDPEEMIILYGLSQIAFAAIHPAMSRLWKANYDDRERIEVTGYNTAIRSIFEMGMAFAITAALDHNVVLFRVLLPVAGFAGAIAQFLLARIPLQGGDSEDVPERVPSDKRIIVEYFHLLTRNRKLAFFLFLFFFYGMANWIHNTLQVPYIEEMLGLNYVQFSLVLFIIPQFCTIISYPFLAKFLARFGIFRCYFVFCLVDAVYYGIMVLADSLFFFTVAKVIKGFSQAGTMILWTIGVLHFGTSKAEVRQFAAVHLSLTGLRALLGPMLGYACAQQFGLRSIFILSGLCSGVALISLLIYILSNRYPIIARVTYKIIFPPGTRTPHQLS